MDYIPPCEKCGGRCCGYVAIEIDRPTTKKEYDHIRWYLVHKDVHVFVDHDKKWHIEFKSSCTHQSANKRCEIYSTRPQICRGHGNSEGDCEYYDTPYSLNFTTAAEFEKWLKKKGIDWKFKKKTD